MNRKELGYAARKVLHVAFNISIGVIILLVPLEWIKPLTVAGFVLILIFESLRLKTRAKSLVQETVGMLFKKEEAIEYSGLFWVGVGALIIALFANPIAISYGFFILALADTAASLAGKAWGHKPFYLNKTWVGSAMFFAIAFLITAFFITLGHFVLPAYTTALLLALLLTLAEAFAYPFDDNFIVLVVATFLMNLALKL